MTSDGAFGTCFQHLCPAGTTDMDMDARTECTPCPAGSFCPEGSVGDPFYMDCRPGYTDHDGDAATMCRRCKGPNMPVATWGRVGECSASPVPHAQKVSGDWSFVSGNDLPAYGGIPAEDGDGDRYLVWFRKRAYLNGAMYGIANPLGNRCTGAQLYRFDGDEVTLAKRVWQETDSLTGVASGLGTWWDDDDVFEPQQFGLPGRMDSAWWDDDDFVERARFEAYMVNGLYRYNRDDHDHPTRNNYAALGADDSASGFYAGSEFGSYSFVGDGGEWKRRPVPSDMWNCREDWHDAYDERKYPNYLFNSFEIATFKDHLYMSLLNGNDQRHHIGDGVGVELYKWSGRDEDEIELVADINVFDPARTLSHWWKGMDDLGAVEFGIEYGVNFDDFVDPTNPDGVTNPRFHKTVAHMAATYDDWYYDYYVGQSSTPQAFFHHRNHDRLYFVAGGGVGTGSRQLFYVDSDGETVVQVTRDGELNSRSSPQEAESFFNHDGWDVDDWYYYYDDNTMARHKNGGYIGGFGEYENMLVFAARFGYAGSSDQRWFMYQYDGQNAPELIETRPSRDTAVLLDEFMPLKNARGQRVTDPDASNSQPSWGEDFLLSASDDSALGPRNWGNAQKDHQYGFPSIPAVLNTPHGVLIADSWGDEDDMHQKAGFFLYTGGALEHVLPELCSMNKGVVLDSGKVMVIADICAPTVTGAQYDDDDRPDAGMGDDPEGLAPLYHALRGTSGFSGNPLIDDDFDWFDHVDEGEASTWNAMFHLGLGRITRGGHVNSVFAWDGPGTEPRNVVDAYNDDSELMGEWSGDWIANIVAFHDYAVIRPWNFADHSDGLGDFVEDHPALVITPDESAYMLECDDCQYGVFHRGAFEIAFMPPSDLIVVQEGGNNKKMDVYRLRVCPRGMVDHDDDQSTRCVDCGVGHFIDEIGSTGQCSSFECPSGTYDDDADQTTACTTCRDCAVSEGGIIVGGCDGVSDSQCRIADITSSFVPETERPTVKAWTSTTASFVAVHAGAVGGTDCESGGVYTNDADGAMNDVWFAEFTVDNTENDVDVVIVACNMEDGSWTEARTTITVPKPSLQNPGGITQTLSASIDMSTWTPDKELRFRQVGADSLGPDVSTENVWIKSVTPTSAAVSGSGRRLAAEPVDIELLITLDPSTDASTTAAIITNLQDSEGFAASLTTNLESEGLIEQGSAVTVSEAPVQLSGQIAIKFAPPTAESGVSAAPFAIGVLIIVLVAVGVWKATESSSIKTTAAGMAE